MPVQLLVPLCATGASRFLECCLEYRIPSPLKLRLDPNAEYPPIALSLLQFYLMIWCNSGHQLGVGWEKISEQILGIYAVPESSGTTAEHTTNGSNGHFDELDRDSNIFFISGPLSSE